mgnify:FL=1
MIPNNSNSTNGCDNTSSNCVVWQGPDLSCVDVCNGDTISDVIAKLCEQLVGSVRESNVTDISTINQLCIGTTYGQANTVQELTQNIITELCKDTAGHTDACSCDIPVPECLRVFATKMYGVGGNTITSLPLYNATTGQSFATMLASAICDNVQAITLISSDINDLKTRVRSLETRTGKKAAGPTLPLVRPQFVANTSIKLDRLAVLTEQALGELRNATGTPQDMNTALQYACSNLNTSNRLNGSGTMSASRGWINSPANLAQSFRNMWITLCDTRSAVESIQTTVADPLCSSIIYSVEGTLVKGSTGLLQSINLDFSGSSIPSIYSDCNGRGTKVIITDSSLNTVTLYVNIAGQYQDGSPFVVKGGTLGSLDTSSNYSVRVEFCFASEDNQCAETQTFTIENATPCPVLTVGVVTGSTIPWTISNISLPSNKGYIINVDLKTRAGSLLDSSVFSVYSSTITGSFASLAGSTQYNIAVRISQTGSTEETNCPDTLISTLAPVCASSALSASSANWLTSTSTLQVGANTLRIAEYNSGSSETKWQVGFDATNAVVVTQAATTGLIAGYWDHSGDFVNNQNPLQTISCGGTPYGATGISATDKNSGWKYVNTIKDPLGNMYFVYALINSTSHAVEQVIACCDCASIFLTIPQATYFARKGGQAVVPITAVGYTAGTGTTTWTISSQPDHGTVALNSGSTSGAATFTYTQDNTTCTFDSFAVSMTNNCGTTNVLNIPIVRTDVIRNNDTDINIVVDIATFSILEGNEIKTSWEAIKSEIQSLAVNWTGTVNYIPATNTRSGDYLKHAKGMVESIGNLTLPTNPAIVLPTSGVWFAWMSLPAYWDAAYTGGFPSSMHIISFVSRVDSGASTANYAINSTLGTFPTGWNGQPTTNGGSGLEKYKEDYAGIVDMTSLVAPASTWGSAEVAKGKWASGTVPFVFSQTVVNKISGGTTSVDTSIVAALQMAASITGPDFLTTREYNGLVLGGAVNTANLSTYLLTGGANPNPYTTANGVTGTETKAISPALYIESTTTWNVITEPTLKTYFYGMVGLVQGSNIDTPNNPSAQQMGGAVIYGAHVDSAVKACEDAATVPTNFPIYNMSGDQFDVLQRAYTTQSAATNGSAGSAQELQEGTWYALSPGTGTCTNCVAEYYRTAPYWRGVTNC